MIRYNNIPSLSKKNYLNNKYKSTLFNMKLRLKLFKESFNLFKTKDWLLTLFFEKETKSKTLMCHLNGILLKVAKAFPLFLHLWLHPHILQITHSKPQKEVIKTNSDILYHYFWTLILSYFFFHRNICHIILRKSTIFKLVYFLLLKSLFLIS